ncbi:MAG: hypothetical protein KIT27_04730 [Legionellales bacterium]|nr:hypothetical protein [Legionellales bacterium]
MPDNKKELAQQIRFVANDLGLEDFVVEKDLYVTQAISIVSDVSNEILSNLKKIDFSCA